MAQSEAVLLQQLFNYANQTSNSGVTEDTLGYLNAVKVAIRDKRENNIHDFLKVLKDYEDHSIDIRARCVAARLKVFLRDHPHLILEFNSFVPKKNQITVSPDDSRVSDFVHAVKFTIQTNFHDFLRVLKDYRDRTIDLSSLMSTVKGLLKNYPDLILEFNSFMLKKNQITVSSEDSRALDFIQAVKLTIPHNFHDFRQVLNDYRDQTIDLSSLTSTVKGLLKNYPDLISEFNFFLSSHNPKGNGRHVDQLPWDVLDTICKTLDFEDLFSFSGVCKNWRTFHKSNFVSSQEPLLVRMMSTTYTTGNCPHSYSFISIPNQKVYYLKTMRSFQPPNYVFVGVSSQYFILAHKNKSFMLFNPFTRKKMVINANESMFNNLYKVLLAFEKWSEKYVLVVLCKEPSRLCIYRSRSNGWFTYSALKPKEVVVDFVVLNYKIYVVTDKASIGVLNLNSGNIQFLNLKSTPHIDSSNSFKLVNCDEQLLLFHSISSYYRREVYKIDLSTMNYVKMKTLGDIALFYVSWRNCWALSNPKRMGYESNHVYEVSSPSQCNKYDWNDGCPSKIYPYIRYLNFNLFDWCFRHVKYEVDYSLVE
ncbi:uncharacterized protein LOC131602050 [Vicia villosa]|uniref:uncharacterized protein LOC131602050 n=1 Tax=Vicia villosa TaxID=3911 RepID=UPI00273C3B6E|nr:uncharacterized protein LOC131602050 [Vicia villosa]